MHMSTEVVNSLFHSSSTRSPHPRLRNTCAQGPRHSGPLIARTYAACKTGLSVLSIDHTPANIAGHQEAAVTLVRVIARPLIASGFVFSGVDRLKNAGKTAPQLKPVLAGVTKVVPSAAGITSNEKLVGQVLGATQIGAALLLGIGRFSRVAALLLTVTATVNTLVDYRSADASTPEGKKQRRATLLKNLSLVGAVLLATVDTNGRPGLAWRAEHYAMDAKRSATGLGKDAKKQLKKADKAVRKTAADVVGS